MLTRSASGPTAAVIAGLLAAGLLTVAPAGAATQLQDAVAHNGTLGAVSCSSATSCAAVGYYYDKHSAKVTLAEIWNGARWSVKATPNPAGAQSAELSSVSCSSATSCAAVGLSADGSAVTTPLAETWNGTAWAIAATPEPPGAQSAELTGISCSSATSCTAVGDYFDSSNTQVTLAERWNGTRWSVKATPNPTGAQSAELTGISCSSATSCVAVGDYFDSSNAQVTLAEKWNGTRWSVKATPNPAGAQSAELTAVSCSSPASCVAVGAEHDSTGASVTLAEAWNGKHWSLQATPNPGGAGFSRLTGVSCASGTSCVAVGDYRNGSDAGLMLAERWNGTAWSIKATPEPSGALNSQLTTPSCTSSASCIAVGGYESSAHVAMTLAEAWSGGHWSVQATPNPVGTQPN
jgi:hypothetical protein